MLIDNGVTCNFISSDLVKKLTIPMEETRAYRVLLKTTSVQGVEIFKGVLIRLQEVDIVEDFLPFNLTSSDVILGIQWLETLGDVQINQKLQRMRL